MHPDFKDMPKPAELKTLYWEDIWEEALETCQDRHNRDPTREEIVDIFNTMVESAELQDNDPTRFIVDAVEDFYNQ